MGRRSTTNKQQMTRGIIDAASRCFGGSGYAQITVDDIAHEASVSKPMLYRSFDSKAELYEVVLNAHAREFTGRLDAALDRFLIMDQSEVVRTLPILAVFVDYAKQCDDGYRLLFESEVVHDPEFAGIVKEFIRSVRIKLLSVPYRCFGEGLTEEVRHTESQVILGSTINIARKIASTRVELEVQELTSLYRSLLLLPKIAEIDPDGVRTQLRLAC
ncbi:TetR/AcrR family transcriptional regulator [Rothia sp. AR01]|uniref:TetR/AcrR family transcriptional regulator n=1 Tax=Rothia santali TaxID=2949643 RepID=A0A9X2HLC3_9MICC|nr:TetR/AcrR family transcriptional regulator [Rothia santali]MCP3426373.1 TetR/AcrR family transcriptional regulator [Rothia santali]